MIKKVLLVADEKENLRGSIQEELKNIFEYEIISQTSLDKISWSTLGKADIIMVDYKSNNGRNGIEFVKQLKTQRPDLRIPVVLFGNSEEMKQDEWSECIELGVKDFLGNEIPPLILKSKIDNIIQSEKYRLQVESLKNNLNRTDGDAMSETMNLSEISKLIKDPVNWNFLYRVISQGGPIHRREVNVCFLMILNFLLLKTKQKVNRDIKPYPYETIKPDVVRRNNRPHSPGRRHHPPHHELDLNIPIGLPSRLIHSIYKKNSPKMTDAAASLFDGPPHEVYMNILFLHIFEQFLTLLEGD